MDDVAFSNRELKEKEEELKWIRPILEDLNFPTDNGIFYERPDFVLPSNKGGKIGIEFTLCTGIVEENNIRAFNEILEEYASLFDSKKEREKDSYNRLSCEIKIWLFNGCFPSIEKCKKVKQQIFHEIDQYLFPNQDYTDNQYICYAEARENSRLLKSVASVVYVAPYVSYEQIENVIKRKERKLIDYKTCNNSLIEEYWLVIGFPNHEPVELLRYELGFSGDSSYNRIYLINKYGYCQFK